MARIEPGDGAIKCARATVRSSQDRLHLRVHSVGTGPDLAAGGAVPSAVTRTSAAAARHLPFVEGCKGADGESGPGDGGCGGHGRRCSVV